MLVFPEKKLVILAVPKTGTTALDAELAGRAGLVLRNPPRLKHMTLSAYQRELAPVLARRGAPDLETLAVIREPVAWVASWYRYRRRPALEGKPNSTLSLSFAEFVRAVLAPEPPACAGIGRQARFVAPAEGQRGVDHLFRFEEMPRLLAFLSVRLGVHASPPRRNASPPADITLPPDLLAELRAGLADDIALWERIGAR